MPMDAVFLHGLTQELTQSLTGARIDKVQQPERDLLLLSVRTQGGNARLLVHGGVGSARRCSPPRSRRRRRASDCWGSVPVCHTHCAGRCASARSAMPARR